MTVNIFFLRCVCYHFFRKFHVEISCSNLLQFANVADNFYKTIIIKKLYFNICLQTLSGLCELSLSL